MVLLSWFLSLA